MDKDLLEIQPLDLKFVFEVNKQSSCIIQLGNKSDQYVAFKVKTTSPKKYCVRPNVGIIKPKATSDFTVTMQAQLVAPPDLQCKDKFLIQSIVVPFGITDEDITSNMFAKESGKYIEEKKLRVVLVSPPQSPVLLPKNGKLEQESPKPSLQKDRALSVSGVENIPPRNNVVADMEALGTAKVSDELTEANHVQRLDSAEVTYELTEAKDVLRFETAKVTNELTEAEDVKSFETDKITNELSEAKGMQRLETSKHPDEIKAATDFQSRSVEDLEEMKPAKGTLELKLAKDFEELKLRLSVTDLRLKEAEHTIMKLKEERSLATREKDMLKHELEVLRRKNNVRKVLVGFPILYICTVALISLVAGYLAHPQSRPSL